MKGRRLKDQEEEEFVPKAFKKINLLIKQKYQLKKLVKM